MKKRTPWTMFLDGAPHKNRRCALCVNWIGTYDGFVQPHVQTVPNHVARRTSCIAETESKKRLDFVYYVYYKRVHKIENTLKSKEVL